MTKIADTADGVCDADCSLREAVSAANATPGAVFVPAGTYTLGAADGDLDVTAGMAIYGAGAGETVINANNVDRVIHVDPGNTSRVSLTLADVTLLDGQVSGDGGGLLAMGVGNYTDLDSVVVDSATATGNGGGIRLQGRGRIVRSVVSGNQGLARRRHQPPGRLERDRRGARLDDRVEYVDLAECSRRRRAALGVDDRGRQHDGPRQHGERSVAAACTSSAPASPALRSVTVSGNTSDSDANGVGTGGGVRIEGAGSDLDPQLRPRRQHGHAPHGRRAGLLEGRHRHADERLQSSRGRRGRLRDNRHR